LAYWATDFEATMRDATAANAAAEWDGANPDRDLLGG
jgi:hypothetical protein